MSMEDTSQGPQAPTDPSSCSSSLERRPSADEDSAAMTIEFLRARLLSERSVSKAARQRAQQLSEKISELEERLEAEIERRKKLEADRVEILSKYRAELSEEYGEFFDSTFGEGLSRNESHMPNEEEGMSRSRTEHLDTSDSSQRLNHEDANYEDDETDQSGREKGVLSWGRQKGSRKEFGHGTDWLGRSLSQRSLASTDGESPQKKWAGKSVRQNRIRENRPFGSNFEGEPGQSQVSEDLDCKSGQPDDMKERLQCQDERDTEVERVLERQAELIGQFEAEENAQRAWEAKFKEAKALASYETDIAQSSSSSNMETKTKNGSLAKIKATKLIETESTTNEGATIYSRKVHPEDSLSSSEDLQGGTVQSETFQKIAAEHPSGIESEENKIMLTAAVEKEACPSTDQNKIGNPASGEHVLEDVKSGVENTQKLGSPNKRLVEIDPLGEDARPHAGESSCGVLKDDSSQDQVLSNTDAEQIGEHSKLPAMELGKSSKLKKHLSSSFRFAVVLADAEPVTSSSPHMNGFAVYKQETNEVEEGEVGKEEVPSNGSTADSEKMSGFGFPEHQHGATASFGHHQSADQARVSEDGTFSTEDTESQEKSKDVLHEGTRQQEHFAPGNGVVDHISNHDAGNHLISDSNQEEILKRTALGLGGGQVPARHYDDSPSYPEYRGLGGGLQPVSSRKSSNFPLHPQSNMQPSQIASDGNRSAGMPSGVLNANVYEDTALSSQRRSIDSSFDRVAEVLRALQIAKYQIESSGEQATPFDIDTPLMNGYDGRDVYYAEPPRLPSVYAAPPQYTSVEPYSSRGIPPFSQNMQGWGGMQVGYGAGSSRQPTNAPYTHYPSRVPEPQSFWSPPPSQGVHKTNLYKYDARQYR